jgi:hypothetical protein
VQQSCGYIDVLLVTWLAKREGDSRCWPCASWSVTLSLSYYIAEDIINLSILYRLLVSISFELFL